jgi:hypothetical protein
VEFISLYCALCNKNRIQLQLTIYKLRSVTEQMPALVPNEETSIDESATRQSCSLSSFNMACMQEQEDLAVYLDMWCT